jgi:hypothetical protein
MPWPELEYDITKGDGGALSEPTTEYNAEASQHRGGNSQRRAQAAQQNVRADCKAALEGKPRRKQIPSTPEQFAIADWRRFEAQFAEGIDPDNDAVNGNFELVFMQYFNCNGNEGSPGPTREAWFRAKGAKTTSPYVVLHIHYRKQLNHKVDNAAVTFKWVTHVNARWSSSAASTNHHTYCPEVGRMVAEKGLNLTGKHSHCRPKGSVGTGWQENCTDIVSVSPWNELGVSTNGLGVSTVGEREVFRTQFAAEFGISDLGACSSAAVVKVVMFRVNRSRAGRGYNTLLVKSGCFQKDFVSFCSAKKKALPGTGDDAVTVTVVFNDANARGKGALALELAYTSTVDQVAFRQRFMVEFSIANDPAACDDGEFGTQETVAFHVHRAGAGDTYKKRIADKNGQLGVSGPFKRTKVSTTYKARVEGWDYWNIAEVPTFPEDPDGARPRIEPLLATSDTLQRLLIFAESVRALHDPGSPFTNERAAWRCARNGAEDAAGCGGGGGGGGAAVV